ncbi:MAG TPA: sigma-70 family RNA polymerase sigma factor [Candidatus Saccharimonadales bacterium]|nr:sigma-70 family RNA polymerase sigma factor [Candidatus Saccharimonadales bacterium]
MSGHGMSGPNPSPSPERSPAGTDAELLGEVVRGNEAALRGLYDRYHATAQAVAVSITSDAALAEDAVQEAFVQVWRNATRYSSSIGPVRSWLIGIVHHRAVDALRARRPTTGLPAQDESHPGELTAPDPWTEVARRLDRVAVGRALKVLSAAQREVIELAYFGGLTQQEIAAHTSTPLGTVKSRARDGLRVLRRVLSGDIGTTNPGPGTA